MRGKVTATRPEEEPMPPKRRHDGLPEGIYARHRKSCPNAGQPEWSCGCPTSYQAQAWSKRDGRRPTRTFPRLREAVKWRNDARSAVQSGKLAGSRALTLRRASEDFMEAAETKLVLNRSGRPYKPSALRSYRTALDLRILPDYGAHPVIELRRSDWQRLVTTLHKQGLAPSTIRNTFDPVRAIYRRLLSLDEVDVNPTRGLEFPVAEEARDRVAAPAEGALLLAALSYPEKAIYATAMYAGMRRGELQAVEDADVDLDANLIEVRHSWDQEAGRVAVKTKAGRRSLPIPRVLRPILLDHRMRRPWREGLFFGREHDKAFTPSTIRRRAREAWGWKEIPNTKRSGPRTTWVKAREDALEPIGLHECRHTFASLMIAAGIRAERNPVAIAKQLCTLMGHASITQTLDRYGHLFPGSEGEAAAALDAYLEGHG
jgi:integrase